MKKFTAIQIGRDNVGILRNLANGRILRKIKRDEITCRADFWKRVKKGASDECWPWLGGLKSKKAGRNYGVVWFNGGKWSAHRLAWVYEYGPIPDDKHVLHHCDNPPCCNPRHCFLGTDEDNVRDCLSKGRGNRERGSDRYNSVLKDEDVREIRRRYKFRGGSNSGVALAKEFGIGKTMVAAIVNRKRWKHVD